MKKFLILAASAILLACGGGGDNGATQPQSTAPGLPSLVVAAQIAVAPSRCPYGGVSVDTGIDMNGNGLLDPAEVSNTQYVCNGAPGANGASGINALVAVTSEPPGTNCINGGKAVNVGQDVNLDGRLNTTEITSSAYICASGSSGVNPITATVSEPPGANCANGGLKTTSGLDTNANNALDGVEVTSTAYVCNGVNGLSGSAGANGSNGSAGANGLKSLTATVAEAAGANCANGGLKTTSGLDANANNVLDPAEVTSTAYVCNGANGASGTNGANGTNGSNGSAGANGLTSLSLTVAEAAGANCTNGGLKTTSGLDTNANNVLDPAEVTSTAYVCNGANGTNGSSGSAGANGLTSLSAIVAEPAGANCPNGGLKMTNGLDANSSGTLESGEVTSTRYACNAPIPAGVSVYRWNEWSTYDNSTGNWLASNLGSLFGGVIPSNWTDNNALASQISPSGDVLRTLFNRTGRSGLNATVYADSWYSYSSTNGKMAGAVFRVRNNTGSAVNWTPSFYYTSNLPWGEKASVALNGSSAWQSPVDSGGAVNASVVLSLPANQTSTVIFIVGSGPQTFSPMRTTLLAFYNNSLALPPGLEYVDDLDTVVTGW
jgi:hypothetical protein